MNYYHNDPPERSIGAALFALFIVLGLIYALGYVLYDAGTHRKNDPNKETQLKP